MYYFDKNIDDLIIVILKKNYLFFLYIYIHEISKLQSSNKHTTEYDYKLKKINI